MAQANTFILAPPPITTPITAQGPDEHGVKWENRVAQGGIPSGGLNAQWAAHFSAMYNAFIGGIGGANLPSGIYPFPASAGDLTPFLASGFTQQAIVTGAANILPPNPIPPSKVFAVQIIQDSTGGRVVTWDAFYDLGGLTLSTAPDTQSFLFFQINADGSKATLILAGGSAAPNLVYSTQANLATLAGTLGTVNAGLLVWVTDYAHMLQWDGAAFQRGPGDTEHSDTFHDFGAAPTDTGWHICDGTAAVSFLKYDGTLGSRNLPNYTTGAYRQATKATYSETVTAKTLPTISGVTEDTTIGFTPAAITGSHNGANGADFTAVVNISGGALGTDPHHHSLTSANAPIALPGDPIAHNPVITYYRQ